MYEDIISRIDFIKYKNKELIRVSSVFSSDILDYRKTATTRVRLSIM